ncbi:MAG: DUF1028 domain-containing protein [Anaerolineae bacterium]|nr:MAG: DUF1028 domain-containing protein [Anaerolineae bacterium]
MKSYLTERFSTYSIVARDAETGQLGVAVQTHQMCVGRVVPWLLPGMGAVATQAMCNVSFGPLGLAMLRQGVPAPRVVEALVASDAEAHKRQVAVVDAQGRAAAWTGDNCIPEAGHQVGDGYSVQANMMTRDTVVGAMAAAYEAAEGDLAARLMAALRAAQREGGDIRGMQSAALKDVPGDAQSPAWMAVYDLRVDEHQDPVTELALLVRLRNAQLVDGRGHEALEQGQREQALELWEQARARAPELEEMAFWQAVTLADKQDDVPAAAAILHPVLADDPRRAHWIDLIGRPQTCGLTERPGSADELIAVLEAS